MSSSTLRRFRLFHEILLTLAALLPGAALPAQVATARPLLSPTVPGRYIVVFKSSQSVRLRAEHLHRSGVTEVVTHTHLPTAAVAATDDGARALARDPAIAMVVADRELFAHALLRQTAPPRGRDIGTARPVVNRQPIVLNPTAPITEAPSAGNGGNSASGTSSTPGSGSGTSAPTSTAAPTADSYYQSSPQGWAVRAAGGYGAGVLGGTAAGPWNHTLGTGVRIAVLDSGVDAAHPDIAPNLALSLSEIDRSAQPSVCDDGSPADQQGHGTWVASLAAGAMGAGTGRVVGVAPLATLLNIKVLQRMPGSGSTPAQQCAAGEAAGLVSWLLKGIDDAVSEHASVIVLSLGSIVDLYTGDGAGLKAAFDQVTEAAANAGTLIVAAAGNDAFDLSDPRYLELPAQARGVLAVEAGSNPSCAENNAAGAACSAGPVTVPYYSNYGAPLHAVVAPGGNYPVGGDEAVSGWVRGACSAGKPGTLDGMPADAAHSLGCFNLGHAQYLQAMGTSASAGLAGGAAALLRAAHPSWAPATVAASLRSSTITMPGGSVLMDTAGALNYQP